MKVWREYSNGQQKTELLLKLLSKDFIIKIFDSIVKKFKPHYVINYIAQGMVAESWLNPKDWYNTNIVAQTKLYKELFKFKFIKKFIWWITKNIF